MKFDCIGVSIFPIAKGRCNHNALPLFLTIPGPDLFADVPGVVIVHQATDTDDQIILVAKGIDPFRRGNHPNLVFPQIVNKQCGLGPVAAKSGQILYDDSIDFISVHSRRELVQPTAVELHAAYIVIERLPHNGVPMLLGKAMADLLLVQERVHFLVIIV